MPNQTNQQRSHRQANGKDFMPMQPDEAKMKGDETRPEHRPDNLQKVVEQVKSTAGEAYDAATEKATSAIEEKKEGFSGGLTSIAESVRNAGDSLSQTEDQNFMTEYSARYARTAAEKLDQVATYFQESDLKQITRDAEDFGRRNPAIFLGAAFIMGVVAARFLKSSPTRSAVPE